MSTGDKANITTAEQLLQLPKDFGPCELVRGELIMMTPGGYSHGSIQINLVSCLSPFVKRHRLGKITPSDVGFILEPDGRTVRAPDVAFVRADRLPAEPITGFFPGPPDLAVEIRSPSDRPGEIASKIAMYLEMGVRVVWEVDPESKTVTVHRPGRDREVFHENDTLREETLLAGFEVAVVDIFAWD